MTRAEKIVQIAKSYVGQEEILGNKGFKDSALQLKMVEAGWEIGFAWCSLLGEIIWKEGYPVEYQPLLNRLFSASALSTYYNFANSKQFKVGANPGTGSLVIWKHGTDPAKHTGHLGIVTDAESAPNTFKSVEGNTTGNDPNMREGYIVAEKTHKLGLLPNPKGLNLVGFVYVNEQ